MKELLLRMLCINLLLVFFMPLANAGASGFIATGSMIATRRDHTATALPDGKVLITGGYVYTGSRRTMNSAELYDPVTGTFSPTGSMNTARNSHTATLLPDGNVLITGGYNYDGYLNSAELYDPATGTFSPAGSMSTARESHTATLLPNGKVLCTGGYNGSCLNSAELYDPAAGTFTATGSMNTARESHTAILLPNGKVLITGGDDNTVNSTTLNSAELYDPATVTFSPTGSMNTPRKSHTATLLPNGKVLCTGGYNGSYLNSAELYDPATGTFTATGSMATVHSMHTATLLPNGRVLITAGEFMVSAELYDPLTGNFGATGSISTPRYAHTATLLPNGKLLIAGGGSGTISAELYDPATGNFSATGSMTEARSDHTATLLMNGKVLIAGGFLTNSAELYDPATGSFSPTGSMTTVRRSHTATLLSDGKVLISGGSTGDTYGIGHLNSAELYDPATGSFSATGSMAITRVYHTATVLPNGKVLIAGGTSGNYYLNSAELYDPATGNFNPTGSMNAARDSHSATLLPNGKVLIIAGRNTFGTLSSAELYDTAGDNFSATGSISTPRRAHTATLLPNGNLLITGGSPGQFGGSSLMSAELYNSATGTFSPTGSMNTPRESHTATLQPNGKVLISGGYNGLYINAYYLNNAELFDPATGSFSPTGSMTTVRRSHTATLLSDGKILVTGGYTGQYNGGVLRGAELYDPAPLPTISGTPAATAALGVAYSFTPGATNDASFSITGSIPPGLVFNSATGALSGTPATVGTYSIIISAINANGSASLQPFSLTVDLATVPGASTIGTATGGNAQATVTFTPPASDGGSAITGYTVASSPAGGIDSSAGTTGLSHIITGLANGTAYTFTVIATNAAGPGLPSSASSSVIPATVPGAPTMRTVSGGNAQATVTFTAPAATGGSAITGYTVTSKPAGGVDSNAGTTGLSHIITGLTNGTYYYFNVTATNAVGTSLPSNASNYVKPATVPDAPTIGTATGGNAQATVTFTAPANTGGSAITGYTVTSTPAGGVDSNARTTALSHTITGLTNGTAYTFAVTATNAVGSGIASTASNSVTPNTVPGSPAIGTATRGNAQATVTFSAPANTGGGEITGYTVTSTPAGGIDRNAGTTGLSHTITGLTNGTAYSFRVTATNAVGTGLPSTASNIVTPAPVPDAPTIDTATGGNARATVTFTAPANTGGSEITGYTVTSIPAGGVDIHSGTTSLSHTITGLTNGTDYTFTVTAANIAGAGQASSASNSVTPVVCNDPTFRNPCRNWRR